MIEIESFIRLLNTLSIVFFTGGVLSLIRPRVVRYTRTEAILHIVLSLVVYAAMTQLWQATNPGAPPPPLWND